MSGKEAVQSSYAPRVLGHRVLEIRGETWRGHHWLPITGVTISPDGKMVASTLMHTVSLWDVAIGKKLRTFETFESYRDIVTALAFSPDGKMVAFASQEMILLWDVTTGERLLRLEGRWDTSHWLTFSPDGKMVVSISENVVNLWGIEVDFVDAKAEGEDGSRLLQSSLSKSDMLSGPKCP